MNLRYLSTKAFPKHLFFVIIFMVFLWPSSLMGGSSNYSFIFLALAIVLVNGYLKIPNKNLILIISFYFLILLVSTAYQIEFLKYSDRRLISFIIFMTIFSYTIINVNNDMIKAFKTATVILVIYFVLVKIDIYFNILGGAKDGFSAKGNLGNHRYGFVYILAFWILFLNKPKSRLINFIRITCIFIIISGLLLTFSRTGIIALIGSLALFFFSFIVKKKIKFSIRNLLFLTVYSTIILLFIFLLFKFLPVTFKFYDKYLLSVFSIEGFNQLMISVQDKNTSEGYRIFLLGKILKFVFYNPFTGSGFLGCWVMFVDDLQCSAHSQYHDVFFRTGFIGFIIYLYLLFCVFKYLKTTHQDLFWGFISILIYGFFHETFKQSHGAFILAFMLGMMITEKRNAYFSKNKKYILKENNKSLIQER